MASTMGACWSTVEVMSARGRSAYERPRERIELIEDVQIAWSFEDSAMMRWDPGVDLGHAP
jgi:hypothetical protein